MRASLKTFAVLSKPPALEGVPPSPSHPWLCRPAEQCGCAQGLSLVLPSHPPSSSLCGASQVSQPERDQSSRLAAPPVQTLRAPRAVWSFLNVRVGIGVTLKGVRRAKLHHPSSCENPKAGPDCASLKSTERTAEVWESGVTGCDLKQVGFPSAPLFSACKFL